jgi:adenylate cyclase
MALAAGLALLWCMLTLLAQFSGALDGFEDGLIDWRQAQATPPAPPTDELALIAIDNIPPDRPWPWSRLDYSLVLRALIDYAPRSTVFEMNLDDRDTTYSSFDDTFSHIVDRANGVVFAATLMASSDNAPPPATIDNLPWRGNPSLVPRFSSAIWPLATFAGTSPVGAPNMQAEEGLRVRRLPMVFFLGTKMVPSLVLQAVAQDLGADLADSEVQIGRAIFLQRKDGRILRTIPIDDEGRMAIRYRAGPVASWIATFDNVVVYDDQLQHGIVPERDLRELVNRQVWIGRTDDKARERFNTPIGNLSRVEVQMQAERTILHQDYVRPLPPMILAMIFLLVAVAVAASIVRLGLIHSAAAVVVAGAFWIESALLAFRLYNVILPIFGFVMLLFGAVVAGLLAATWEMTEPAPASTPETVRRPMRPTRPRPQIPPSM